MLRLLGRALLLICVGCTAALVACVVLGVRAVADDSWLDSQDAGA